jgi:hypothetical protein
VDVLVMAEHGVRYPLWERLPLPGGGFGDPVDGLPGMSASLGDRLREWNAQLEHHPDPAAPSLDQVAHNPLIIHQECAVPDLSWRLPPAGRR